MVSTKFFLIATLYFTSMKIAHCGDTVACTASTDCTSTQKCIDIDGVNKACVETCTSDADCGGTAGSCATGTDVDGTSGFSVCPLIVQQCLTDFDCFVTDVTLHICNLYTLTCVADTTAMTTTSTYKTQCFTDADCSVINPPFPICNPYTLTCEAYPTTTTTRPTRHKKMCPNFLQFIYNLYIGNN
uniref:Disintegrin domain-containing protein n=1 Tax=Strongyloides papillosus TaxID=174720 RepID=A0A0N5BGR0_STREA